MRSTINILFLGIDDTTAAVIQEAIQQGIGEACKVTVHYGGPLCMEQSRLSQNYYQMIVSYPATDQELLAQLRYIRLFDYRIQIILLIDHMTDYFTAQKYNITFIIRQAQLLTDLFNLTFALSERYQNKQFYMPHQQRFLSVHSIYYLESSKNYIQIYTMEGCFKERFTIKELSSHPSFEQFLLISQSVLLHPLHMKSIDHEKIMMEDGRQLFISRGKLQQVYRKLHDLQQMLLV